MKLGIEDQWSMTLGGMQDHASLSEVVQKADVIVPCS